MGVEKTHKKKKEGENFDTDEAETSQRHWYCHKVNGTAKRKKRKKRKEEQRRKGEEEGRGWCWH